MAIAKREYLYSRANCELVQRRRGDANSVPRKVPKVFRHPTRCSSEQRHRQIEKTAHLFSLLFTPSINAFMRASLPSNSPNKTTSNAILFFFNFFASLVSVFSSMPMKAS